MSRTKAHDPFVVREKREAKTGEPIHKRGCQHGTYPTYVSKKRIVEVPDRMVKEFYQHSVLGRDAKGTFKETHESTSDSRFSRCKECQALGRNTPANAKHTILVREVFVPAHTEEFTESVKVYDLPCDLDDSPSNFDRTDNDGNELCHLWSEKVYFDKFGGNRKTKGLYKTRTRNRKDYRAYDRSTPARSNSRRDSIKQSLND